MTKTTALIYLIAAASAHAQYTTGRVEGSVSDPQGAPVAAAAVTLASLETGQSRQTLSNEAGGYFFAAVNPGRYQVKVEARNFALASAEIAVVTSQTLTVGVKLELAAQTAAVEVVAESASLVNNFEPLRSVTRNSLEIQTLPNLNRNIVNMIVLAPGVTPTFHPRGGNLTTLSIAQAGQMNANGGRAKASAHQLDSTDANDWEFGGIALATQPNPDMLQEFKILSNNWAAEYGVKSSAQVLMVTRSGSNSLHGVAYDYLQNAALNARDYFDRTGKSTPLRQNIFGFTAGGPIVKDRTFFFTGYEGRRARGQSATTIATVPTEAARATVTDPSIKSILPLLPLPTAPTSDPKIGTLAVSAPSPSDGDQIIARGDHYFTPGHSLTLRYYQNLGTSYNRTANSLPEFDATFDPRGRNAMVADSWAVNPQTTNELRLSYGRSSALFSPDPATPVTPRYLATGLVQFGTVQFWPQGRVFDVYGASDLVSHVRGSHILKFGYDGRSIRDHSLNDSGRRGIYNFASVDTFLAGVASGYSQVFGNTYRGFRMDYHGLFLQDDWKLTRTLTLNMGVRWEIQGGLSEANQLQSVLDPRLKVPIGQAGLGVLGGMRNEKPSVQGNWMLVGPRLGFAWNPGGGRLTLRGGYGIHFDSLIFNGLQAGRTTPPSNYTGSLAGAAISGANSLANLFAGTAQIQRELSAQIGSYGSLVNLGGITTTLPTLNNPYVQHYSVGTQYRFSTSMAVDVAYVGTKGLALTTYGPANPVATANRPAAASSLEDERARLAQFQQAAARANGSATAVSPRIDPRFNTVNMLRDNGHSAYHSLQVEFRRALSRGLQVQAGYTYSQSRDNSSDYSPGQATTDRSYPQDGYNLDPEYGPSSFDIPHRFTLSHVWELPFFRGQNSVAARLLGGWVFASINQFQSGIPFTVMSGPRLAIADVNMDGDSQGPFDNARAVCVAGGSGFTFGDPSSIPAASARGVNGAPNSSNFRYVQPLLGNQGTCGRNSERMNTLINFDWTLSKKFLLAENGPLKSGPWALEYRADFFNIMNGPFLTAAGEDFRNLASPLFGLTNAAAPSRRIQMSLRLIW